MTPLFKIVGTVLAGLLILVIVLLHEQGHIQFGGSDFRLQPYEGYDGRLSNFVDGKTG